MSRNIIAFFAFIDRLTAGQARLAVNGGHDLQANPGIAVGLRIVKLQYSPIFLPLESSECFNNTSGFIETLARLKGQSFGSRIIFHLEFCERLSYLGNYGVIISEDF